MSNITELKDALATKTWHLVLLTIATGGIYPLLWLHKNTEKLEKITSKPIANSTFLIWIAVCLGLGKSLSSMGVSAAAIGGLLSIAAGVLYIVWAFKAKAAIEEYALVQHKIDLKMNKFYTFFLTLYYINYCANDLPEVQRKQHILAGAMRPQEA